MIKKFEIFTIKHAFPLSVFLSYVIWFGFYILLPINTPRLSTQTIAFICSSIVVFVFGFYAIKFKSKPANTLNFYFYFNWISILSFVGLIFRYIDLFFYRNLSFNNVFHLNKSLGYTYASDSGLIISLLGCLRVLYVLPIILLIILKNKNKRRYAIALFLIVLSAFQTFLLGTRKPFFYLIILIIITLFYFNKKLFKFSKHTVLYGILTLVILCVFSFFILNKRVVENNFNNKEAFVNVLDSRYNDFVKTKSSLENQLKSDPNSFKTKSQIMFIHTGQYVVHGFYELNYIVNNNFPKAKGVYSFNPLYKLTNRLSLTNIKLTTFKSHPRRYVYTSFYGSLYIDFGWFSLIPLFIFGVFQRWVFSKISQHPIACVFFVFLLSVNLVMPIFNIMSGSGLYLFLSLLIMLLHSVLIKT